MRPLNTTVCFPATLNTTRSTYLMIKNSLPFHLGTLSYLMVGFMRPTLPCFSFHRRSSHWAGFQGYHCIPAFRWATYCRHGNYIWTLYTVQQKCVYSQCQSEPFWEVQCVNLVTSNSETEKNLLILCFSHTCQRTTVTFHSSINHSQVHRRGCGGGANPAQHTTKSLVM